MRLSRIKRNIYNELNWWRVKLGIFILKKHFDEEYENIYETMKGKNYKEDYYYGFYNGIQRAMKAITLDYKKYRFTSREAMINNLMYCEELAKQQENHRAG